MEPKTSFKGLEVIREFLLSGLSSEEFEHFVKNRK